MRYLERPLPFSTCPKFRVIRFEFESVTSLDDCIDELVEQGMSDSRVMLKYNLTKKYLLSFHRFPSYKSMAREKF